MHSHRELYERATAHVRAVAADPVTRKPQPLICPSPDDSRRYWAWYVAYPIGPVTADDTQQITVDEGRAFTRPGARRAIRGSIRTHIGVSSPRTAAVAAATAAALVSGAGGFALAGGADPPAQPTQHRHLPAGRTSAGDSCPTPTSAPVSGQPTTAPTPEATQAGRQTGQDHRTGGGAAEPAPTPGGLVPTVDPPAEPSAPATPRVNEWIPPLDPKRLVRQLSRVTLRDRPADHRRHERPDRPRRAPRPPHAL